MASTFNSKLVFFTLFAVFFVAVSASGSYYNNHYAPIYSINTGGHGHGKRGQGSNNLIIRNSYSTSYGGHQVYDHGYGDDSYDHNNGYNTHYSNCISNLSNHGGKRNKHGNDNSLLLALLGGCGGGLGGHY